MFIQNTGRYALAFTIEENGRECRVEFDRRRIYLDTGNIATNGVTEITDEQFEKLNKIPFFEKQFKNGNFKKVEKIETADDAQSLIKEKDKEIAKLKKALEKSDSKKEIAAKDAAIKEKDDEINSLKAKLESLTKKEEPEGF